MTNLTLNEEKIEKSFLSNDYVTFSKNIYSKHIYFAKNILCYIIAVIPEGIKVVRELNKLFKVMHKLHKLF